ncbi:MAG: internalin related protein [Firmicutes bacterium]|nr:internalin related protein [Bacillota bacterium]
MEKIQGLDYYLQSFSCRDMVADKCVSLLQGDISGGRLTKNDIDSLKDCDATEIWISGLTQDTFEYFIETYGQQFKIIYFWKCPLITDFKKLETLKNIEYLIFFWNQRVTHLWDLSKNPKLRGLSFDDFTRMHTLEEIPLAPILKELYFGNMIWSNYILDSLTPLSRTKKLKKLIFSAKKINDNDITPLAKIANLERLDFNSNLFSTEQIAWLTANTANITSFVLAPYKKIKNPLKTKEKTKDVLVIGKRKPFLNSQEDKVRLEKYVMEFNDLINKYRGCERP